MKRLAYFFIAFSVLAGIVTWRVKAQTVGDDLAVALTNHGVDAVTAPIAATAIEIAVKNQNVLLARIASDEVALANLATRVQKLETPSASSAPVVVQAEAYASISGGPSTPTQAGGTGMVLAYVLAGEKLTYSVTVPFTGNYAVSVNATAEAPGVVSINGQPASIPNTGGWDASQYISVPGPVLALTAGQNTITVVIQTTLLNLDFFTFTKTP